MYMRINVFGLYIYIRLYVVYMLYSHSAMAYNKYCIIFAHFLDLNYLDIYTIYNMNI